MHFTTLVISSLAALAAASPVSKQASNPTAFDYFCSSSNLQLLCNSFGKPTVSVATASFGADCQTLYSQYHTEVCQAASSGTAVSSGCSELQNAYFTLDQKKCLPSWLQSVE